MDELYCDQLLRGIDPEIRAPGPAPGETPDRPGHRTPGGIAADPEAEPEGRANQRPHVAAGEADAGRQRIRGHLADGCGREDAHPIEFAAVEQHLAEP